MDTNDATTPKLDDDDGDRAASLFESHFPGARLDNVSSFDSWGRDISIEFEGDADAMIACGLIEPDMLPRPNTKRRRYRHRGSWLETRWLDGRRLGVRRHVREAEVRHTPLGAFVCAWWDLVDQKSPANSPVELEDSIRRSLTAGFRLLLVATVETLERELGGFRLSERDRTRIMNSPLHSILQAAERPMRIEPINCLVAGDDGTDRNAAAIAKVDISEILDRLRG